MKHEKLLHAARHHTKVLSCDVCNLQPGAALRWWTGFIYRDFSFFICCFHTKYALLLYMLYFTEITDPTEKMDPLSFPELSCGASNHLFHLVLFILIGTVVQDLLSFITD